MPSIKNFEDLQSWQKARELAGCIYGLTRKADFSHDYGLRDQIQRAASSVMHNIAEGFESGTDPEFARFLKMARRSAGEVQSELYLAFDCKYITQEEFQRGHDLTIDAKKLINGMMAYLRKSDKFQTRRLVD
ncbi:MAG TPA: four helix bundle protein [Anaerolineales bacterium]|jgi:four helix bundle protein|nr:four helix bundle protein [Anaerolineales bacterium]